MNELRLNTQKIWEEFGSGLRAFIRRRVQDDHVADDLFQDVFVRIHDKLGTLNDNERIAAWIFRVARNAIVDHYRRRTSDGFNAPFEIEAIGETDDENINDQVAEWLRNLMLHLPDSYREAVILSELDRIPQVEIAERIGLSVSGTKSKVQRGRFMLKEMLLR